MHQPRITPHWERLNEPLLPGRGVGSRARWNAAEIGTVQKQHVEPGCVSFRPFVVVHRVKEPGCSVWLVVPNIEIVMPASLELQRPIAHIETKRTVVES